MSLSLNVRPRTAAHNVRDRLLADAVGGGNRALGNTIRRQCANARDVCLGQHLRYLRPAWVETGFDSVVAVSLVCDPLKVGGAVVGLNAVLVVDLCEFVRVRDKGVGDKSMNRVDGTAEVHSGIALRGKRLQTKHLTRGRSRHRLAPKGRCVGIRESSNSPEVAHLIHPRQASDLRPLLTHTHNHTKVGDICKRITP